MKKEYFVENNLIFQYNVEMDKTKKYRNHKFSCKQCNKIYVPKCHKKIGTTEFCSRKCVCEYLSKNKITKKCISCKKKFNCSLLQQNKAKTCSQKCYDDYRYNQIVGVCEWCDIPVKRRTISIRKKMFCSKICAGSYKTYFSEPKYYGKKKIWFNIKNNIKIFCEKCNLEDIDVITIHHIDNNRKNNEINNLMLLCYNCHFKIHHNETISLKKYIDSMERNHAFKTRKLKFSNK